MTAILEDLDIAEVLAYRNMNTPLWDDLMDAYGADDVAAIGAGWPPVMSAAAEPASEEDEEGTGDGEAEAGEEPAADSPDTAPAEADPTAS